jgi:quercetin dioxygenase-like cupin family protein
MEIEAILNKLEGSDKPVAQAIHKSEHAKALVIAFKKGMVLKEHKASLPSTLLVIKGSILYREENIEIRISQFGNTNIPINEVHSLEALEDSICLLIQG